MDDVMWSEPDELAHIEDSIANGDFEMTEPTNLMTILAGVPPEEQDCTCGRSLSDEVHADDCPITAVDANIARIEEATRQKINAVWGRVHSFCVTPLDSHPQFIENAVITLDSEDGEKINFDDTISATTASEYIDERADRDVHAREAALCDGSSDDPLDEGFHGLGEPCDHAQSVEEQIAARQPWAPEGCPVRTRRQEKEQFLAQHPEFQFPDDRQVGPILACNIPLQEVIRQVRSALACVTEPGSEHNPANARAERSYRAFLLAVEAE